MQQKDKTIAGLLGLFLGGLGVHKFYLNKPVAGVLYFVFSWTFIPSAIGFIEGIHYLMMDPHRFNAQYNYSHQLMARPNHALPPATGWGNGPQQPYQAPNIHANQGPNAHANQWNRSLHHQAPQRDEVFDQLERLNELRISGVLSEAEFQREKDRLLG